MRSAFDRAKSRHGHLSCTAGNENTQMRVLLDDGFDNFKTWIAGCSSPQLEKHLPSFFFVGLLYYCLLGVYVYDSKR